MWVNVQEERQSLYSFASTPSVGAHGPFATDECNHVFQCAEGTHIYLHVCAMLMRGPCGLQRKWATRVSTTFLIGERDAWNN